MDYQDFYTVLPKEPKRWKQDDVTIWLEYIGLVELDPKFRSNAVDGTLLSTLDSQDLKEMGIVETSIKLKKLNQWIQIGFKEYTQYIQQYHNKQVDDDQQLMANSTHIQTSQAPIKKSQIKAVTFGDDQSLPQIDEEPHEETHIQQQVLQPPKIQSTQPLQLSIIDLSNNQKIKVNHEGLTIGRSPDNNLVIKEDYISRFHCKIHYRESNKQYYIQDLGSSSGTFIQLLNPTLLKEGVILQMGEGEYMLKRLQVEDTICQVIFEATEGVMKGQNLDFQLAKDQTALAFGRNLSLFEKDSHLSQQHAQFTFIEDGLVVEDLESQNGTWLRMSAPQKQSEQIRIINDRRFRLANDKYFDCELK